ncbi:putative hydrolases or acyltransferase [Polyplosphaeria fusca]|uniref:Hydrolases or acyltransferase n=1 Tax=Polyplosphaeria fusca TaxID=682080 RepID=A0A9P4QNP2_9PLEO|nr:putative hydrolases or acyltransferase [Polyplosphaeria fusca]
MYAGPLVATMTHCLAAGDNSTQEEPMLQLSSDSTFHFDMMAPFGLAIAGGSDVGPMLGIAQDIEAGNMESFTQQFYKLASQTKAQAEDPDNSYDAVNVRDTWFSASTYFRKAANYILANWSDPRIDDFWAEQTAAFDRGLAALPTPGSRVRIPATGGNFTVEAVWYAASENDQATRAPTLIVGNGFDAAQEDSFHVYCVPALARGWNCITYEGPGQPTVRRNQNIGFIPEWELVVAPVVDFLLREKAHLVDPDMLALVGNSLGGYLAARAAAFEPRLAAVLLVDGMWDFSAVFFNGLPAPLVAMFEAGNHSDFDAGVSELRRSANVSTEVAWGIDQGLWAFNTHSPSDMVMQSTQYRVQGFIDKIMVPVFVGDAEFDGFFDGQPQLVSDALGDKATLHKFTGVAGYHCQVGAGQELARVLFAWLNKTLGRPGNKH